MVRHYFYLQDIKISFEEVDFYAKLSITLDTLVRNLTTQRTIVSMVESFVFQEKVPTKTFLPSRMCLFFQIKSFQTTKQGRFNIKG